MFIKISYIMYQISKIIYKMSYSPKHIRYLIYHMIYLIFVPLKNINEDSPNSCYSYCNGLHSNQFCIETYILWVSVGHFDGADTIICFSLHCRYLIYLKDI